jgi:phosphinothricin acetyltransferase
VASAPAIRPAREADLPAIAAIYADQVLHGTASFEIEPPGLEEMQRRWSAIVAAGLPYIVAELDGAVAGYAYAGPYRPRPAYRFTVENSVYVAPGFHRRGIGGALLAALVAMCRQAGRREIVAIIGDSGNQASIALHRAAGFRLVGVLEKVGRKHERWLDTVIMQRSLQDDGR